MVNKISFKEAMLLIDKLDKNGNPFPFDIKFRTLQRNSKTGGRLIEYKGVKKYKPKPFYSNNDILKSQVQSGMNQNKTPNHYKNRTRNLELQNGEKRKIHIRLIDSINGKKMHY